jgi:hypothetical protein
MPSSISLVALLCPVCYAPGDPQVTESLNLGIFVLLGVTAVVLAAFLLFIVSVARRTREVPGETVDPLVNH